MNMYFPPTFFPTENTASCSYVEFQGVNPFSPLPLPASPRQRQAIHKHVLEGKASLNRRIHFQGQSRVRRQVLLIDIC